MQSLQDECPQDDPAVPGCLNLQWTAGLAQPYAEKSSECHVLLHIMACPGIAKHGTVAEL